MTISQQHDVDMKKQTCLYNNLVKIIFRERDFSAIGNIIPDVVLELLCAAF